MESVLRAEDGEETMLRTLALRQAVEALPEKERTIIALRYFRAYTRRSVLRWCIFRRCRFHVWKNGRLNSCGP